MSTKNSTVRVNGREYDSKTGLPVESAVASTPTPTTHTGRGSVAAKPVHKQTRQKSQTLSRKGIAPNSVKQTGVIDSMTSVKRRLSKPSTDISRVPRRSSQSVSSTQTTTPHHPAISRFAAPSASPTTHSSTTKDLAPTVHPHTVKVQAAMAKRQTPPPKKTLKSAAVLKREAIERAMREPVAPEKPKKPLASFLEKRRARHALIGLVTTVGVFAIAGVTWINMPALSVQLAAAQAGISANYPSFQPDGYSLVLPVEHEADEIRMTFKANGGPTTFTLSQSKSSWDSSAVKEQVDKDSKGQYLTTQDRGLTIYTYNGNAAWVNKGILYQIKGDARLPNDYILKIANSL